MFLFFILFIMNFYVMFILPNMKKKDEITVLFFTKESSINRKL